MKVFVNKNKTVWKLYAKTEDIVLIHNLNILGMMVSPRYKSQTQEMIGKGEVILGNHLVSNEEVHSLIKIIWTVDEVKKMK